MKRALLPVLLFLTMCVAGEAYSADQVFFYLTAPAGSPLAMTDSAGQVVWKADYRPFGEEQAVTGTVTNDRKFVGKEKDDETGLYYFGARYENPKTGRFIAPDPVRAVDPGTGKTNEELLLNPQRLNTYAYGLNNPYRYVDPDGLIADLIHFTDIDKKPLRDGARNVPSDPKVFQIAAHGGPQRIVVNGERLSADQYANYLKDKRNGTGYKKDTPIRLLGCRMGEGDNSFAKQLSNKLGVTVEAADNYFWFASDGSYTVYGINGKDKKGNYIKDMDSQGKMIKFGNQKER